jgi:hypothetical protein
MWLMFSLSQSMRLIPTSWLEIEVDFSAMAGVVWLAMRETRSKVVKNLKTRRT